MSFADEHARALENVAAAGAAVTWTRTVMTEDPEAGTVTPTETEIEGQAVRIQPRSIRDQQLYEGLGLRISEAPRLLFVPTTYGDEPQVGDRTTWGGKAYTARDVNTLAPDGKAILSKVVVSK